MIKQDILENRVNIAYLSIGSNLGNKKKNIEKAKYFLEKNLIKIVKTSSIYETYSWPNRKHPKFYNIVIKIITKLKPGDLFFTNKKIEKILGRKKSSLNNPRTCDIDILDYQGMKLNLNVNNNKLLIPHPRLHNRNFVLFPLFEIEKNWKHPLKKTKIYDLIGKLDNYSFYSIKQI
ncbi:2-amino-4-hydroxy-6-hydroxymethyldihydropteridine diphosphokinase [Candidatus Pelagibacter sp.]|nr:2-amino-4-hydroxy-6-hydroxymethyldihydropteridine diphosphokinase [Candidatus Pelagibacter sp.]